MFFTVFFSAYFTVRHDVQKLGEFIGVVEYIKVVNKK